MTATRLANAQERLVATERRLSEVRDERERLQWDAINEADVNAALAQFDAVWGVLSLREQAQLLQLPIERIDYDGRDGALAITFHPHGIQSLLSREIGEAA
jgi:hypothetical protein